MSAENERASLPRASVVETLGVAAGVFAPTVAKGVIIRRPRAVALAERMDLDLRAVRRLRALRKRYGSGPLMLRLPLREQAVILDPDHVHRVLEESPDPFSTASSEKRSALSHFQPEGALITPPGAARRARRRFNEQVLESENPMHRLSERFLAVAGEETERLIHEVRRAGGMLDWDRFSDSWFNVVRRVVFGDGARDDEPLRELVDALRGDANWAFLRPRRDRLRTRFFERLDQHLARAEPGSLAQVMASIPRSRETAPEQQVPQWLFAFDPAGMATFRALALLASHPSQADRARASAGRDDLRPFLRASVLESLRLWPTTPMVLRQTTRETHWEEGVMPAETGVLIFAPLFHRDEERLTEAHRFSPELWLGAAEPDQARPGRGWPLIPFSAGPAICPGRNLVLLLASRVLEGLLAGASFRMQHPDRLDAARPLPGTLNHASLRFTRSA